MGGRLKLYNMIDRPASDVRAEVVYYRVWVGTLIEETETSKIVYEWCENESFDTLRDALRHAASFIRWHGGFENWDELDGRVGSCWMDYHDPFIERGRYSVSYTLWVEKVTQRRLFRDRGNCVQIIGREILERELRLTMKRLAAAL